MGSEMCIRDRSVTIPGTSNIYNQMHHHGPAFESELVAYRLYFDHKQTVDIYGKFNKGFEIKESQFYPTDEQLARGFGDDVLMVGGSCGVGALKGWDGKKATHITPVATLTERIIAYGPVRTISERFVWRSSTISAPVLVSEKRSAASQMAMMALRQAPLKLGSL